MSQITNADFEQMLKEQNQNSTKKWADLEKNKVYTIVDYNIEDGFYGESMVLSLSDGSEVWAPEHLKEKIKRARAQPPYYVRPLGLKPSKNNKNKNYHAYDLVIPPK